VAAATSGDTTLEGELVDQVGRWFAEREALYRSAGMIATTGPRGGDPQSDLLASFGRDVDWGPNHAALAAFSTAFGSGDVEAVMALMTDDCVFESTGPAPDGGRFEGAAAVRAVWQELFDGTPDASFTEEESFVAGDRAVLRWRFSWTNADGSPGHVRGVDVIRLRDGKVSQKLSYVKG
jgi:ketosteroid isomerase-like protein